MRRMKAVNALKAATGRSLLSRRNAVSASTGSTDSADQPGKGQLGLITLYCPEEPCAADIVFVHGLGGGSFKSWTVGGDPELFWPQEWLPKDAAFANVRIHSFGYDSDWKKKSVLNIHDFGKSLLAALQDCPLMPKDTKAPIIFVGHSMGGLVIKRAVILAKQMGKDSPIADRIRSIIFLATPHRGADLASTATKILGLRSGTRPFVDDLQRNSLATQSINDEFPHHSKGLLLYSFYEIHPTNYGIGESIIVEKDMAVLGLPNERSAYLSANHREVAKFSLQSDPNYQKIRNALISIIKDSEIGAQLSRQESIDRQRKFLDDIFGNAGATDSLEDDLGEIEATRMRGSCEWFLQKQSFQHWRDDSNPSIFWLSAPPATGKTVLSGMLINHLRERKLDCAFYFFDFRDKSKTSLRTLLLSMAWQMSCIDLDACQVVHEACKKDGLVARADQHGIWRKLFINGLLRVKYRRPQYWVIDALDESSNESELLRILQRVVRDGSVRILLTCRLRPEVLSRSPDRKVKIVSEPISASDIEQDIKKYVEQTLKNKELLEDQDGEGLVNQILASSDGSFLWVSLILKELNRVHTSAETHRVLENVPSDMNSLYRRILDKMSVTRRSVKLAQAILTWTVCSARPLSAEEMHHALQIDLKDRIFNVRTSVEDICGQLVHIDTHGRMQMIHKTARDYLLHAEDSEFAVRTRDAHRRIALVCLEYLNGEEMMSRRNQRLSDRSVHHQRSPFAEYACNFFFDHIFHIGSTDDAVLSSLVNFLSSSNVLVWIEYVAEYSSLYRIIKAGKALRNFVRYYTRHLVKFDKQLICLDLWATDLVRLVTKFGHNLLSYPPSIYHLIPPFCPASSAIYEQFVISVHSIQVLGLKKTTWDTSLASISNTDQRCSALATSAEYFALGMWSGKIYIYNDLTCQEVNTLEHGEKVQLLQFSESMRLLTAVGYKTIRVWNIDTWTERFFVVPGKRPLIFAIYEDDRLLLSALNNNHLVMYNLETGASEDSIDWIMAPSGINTHASRQPMAAALCLDTLLLAVIYRGQDILVWDLEADRLHDSYCKRSGSVRRHATQRPQPGPLTAVFSRSTNAGFLAAAYSDGDIVVFDTVKGTVKATVIANSQILACSPDGQILACVNSVGLIQLFQFETLKLLYRLDSKESGCSALEFSTDGYRLFNICGSHARIWDISVLTSTLLDDDDDDASSMQTVAQESATASSEDEPLIQSVVCHSKHSVAFCGTENGSIWICDLQTGKKAGTLLSRKEKTPISFMSLYSDSNTLVIYIAGSVTAYQLSRQVGDSNTWTVKKSIFDHTNSGLRALRHILLNQRQDHMLLCTDTHAELWQLSDEGAQPALLRAEEHHDTCRWITHPSDPLLLIRLSSTVAHLFTWHSLEKVGRPDGIALECGIAPDLCIRSAVMCLNSQVLITTFTTTLRPNAEPKLLLWDPTDFSPESVVATPAPEYRALSGHIKAIVGDSGGRMCFLHETGWVCTASVRDAVKGTYSRHFSLPAEWLCTNAELLYSVRDNGDFVFVRGSELAVVKHGLDNVEPFDSMPRRHEGITSSGGLHKRVLARRRTSWKSSG